MSGGYFSNPRIIGEIPLHRFADSAFEGLLRLPIQFPLNLARVHGITPVVARPILDVGNQLAVRDNGIRGTQFIKSRADGVHDLKIWLLISSTDVIGLADFPASENGPDSIAVICNIQPVAHILAVTINWDRLAGHGIQDG